MEFSMLNYPVTPVEWQSSYDQSKDFDYLYSKKHEGIVSNHHCKLTWELSKPFVKNFRNALDIGCRDGEFSHYLFPAFKHVYSFDYRKSANFPKNVPHDNVTWFVQGLSNKIETVIASGGGQLDNMQSVKKKMQVTLYPLDAFNFTEIDYIKIDTDGYEMRIIEGAIETLKNNDPVLVIEQGYFDKKEALSYCVKNLGFKHVATCDRELDYILIKEK